MATTIGVGAEYARGSVRDQLTGGKRDHSGRIFQLLLLAVARLLARACWRSSSTTCSSRASACSPTGPSRSSPAASARTPRRSGVFQAIKGTFWIGVFVVVLSFPIGVASAVYLEEYATKGRFARLIDVNIRNLAGVPSIVYGILGLALFVQSMEAFTGGRTLMAAGITLAILVLPIVIITGAEAVRAVPELAARGGVRRRRHPVGGRPHPGAALRAPRHHHRHGAGPRPGHRRGGPALPGAVPSPGCSPGKEGLLDPSQLQERFTALPVVIAEWARNPREGFSEIAAAAIMVMLVIVLVMNTIAILLRTHYEKKRS